MHLPSILKCVVFCFEHFNFQGELKNLVSELLCGEPVSSVASFPISSLDLALFSARLNRKALKIASCTNKTPTLSVLGA